MIRWKTRNKINSKQKNKFECNTKSQQEKVEKSLEKNGKFKATKKIEKHRSTVTKKNENEKLVKNIFSNIEGKAKLVFIWYKTMMVVMMKS